MEISVIEHSDVFEISKLLKRTEAITTHKVVKELLDHLGGKGLAVKGVTDDCIVAIWFSKEFDTHTSLSYFFTDESIRRKPDLMTFFKTCVALTNAEKPILIKATSIIGFERYVTSLGDGIYQFKGLR